MEYISVSSLVSDFWSVLFYPLIKISLLVLLMQYIFGKHRFDLLKAKLFVKLKQYSNKIKYRDRLKKAVPIVNTFLFFSFLYLFSIFSSAIDSFFPMRISFGNDYPSSETVLNVWQYHPYIDDYGTLQRVVSYKARESELGKFKLLSTEGLREMPEMLLRSLIVFVLILLIFLIVFLIIKIVKKGFRNRLFMILRAIFVLFTLICLFVGISFLNKNYSNNYNIKAWNQYELQLLSSGAPPESDMDIKNEKYDEVNRRLENSHYDFYCSLGFGSAGISITYDNHHFECRVIHYGN